MAYYGYIRVSTKGQVPGTSLAEQEQQIKERYPTAIIVKEAASGAHERQVYGKDFGTFDLSHGLFTARHKAGRSTACKY